MALPAELLEGFDHVETAAELEKRLALGRPLRVKLGLDPTSADLHLGHTVILSRLQRFIHAGHHAILVIGDFTARIGDPSGRNELRPALSDEQIKANMATYTQQAGHVLDLKRVEIRYNSEWLAKLALDGLLRLLSHVTVAQMLQREDFAKRYESGVPIALHEFLYPVAQAYDSVELQADVELGGNDQLFNLLMGRHYQVAFGQAPQICLTSPLLEGLDGIKKMSKSLGNSIGLTEAPADQFGKTMRIPDDLIPRWAQLVLDRPLAEITRLGEELLSGRASPMEEKKRLAQSIVERFHGSQQAIVAREYFERTIQRREVPQEITQELELPSDFRLIDALLKAGFAESKREAQRLISSGAVRFNNEVMKDAAGLPESFTRTVHIQVEQTLLETLQSSYHISSEAALGYLVNGQVLLNCAVTRDPHQRCSLGSDLRIDSILSVGSRRFVRLKIRDS